MEVSTGNIPGFVFSKLSLLQLASQSFVLSNGKKHCYIATMRKMLNNIAWVLLARHQLCHICLKSTNESAILHYLYNRFIRITAPLPWRCLHSDLLTGC
jgi:hypothetical protein